jgi:integrase
MASLEKRETKSGTRWRIVWWQDGGRQQQTYLTEAVALSFKAKVEAYGNQWPPGTDPREKRLTGSLTFGTWAERAIERRTRATERTKADYRRDLQRHFALLADVPLESLSEDHISAWERDRHDAGLADKTIRNLHGFASSLLGDARRHRPPLVDHNPFEDRLRSVAAVHVEEMTFLTPPEFETVLGYVREEYRDLIRLLFGTGLRFGEATALQIKDVELFGKRKTLTVTKAWKRTGTSSWEVGEPKTPRSRRTVSIGDELVDMLIPHVSGRRSDALLFPGPDGDRLPHIDVWKRGWAPAVARANVCAEHYEPQRDGRGSRPRLPKACDCAGVLGKTPRIHDLRHSHVAMLVSASIPLAVVSRRLGHSSINITMDRYGHLDPAVDDSVNAATDRAMARR